MLHFGAKGDGTTDDSDAFMRMYNWTKTWNANYVALPVRFPGGKFLIKPIDFSASESTFFGLLGDDSELGSLPRTTIISDKSATPVFKVKARRTAIRGMARNGQASVDTVKNTGTITADLVSNNQPFNTCIEGETVNIHCFRAQNTGGTVLKLLDTLDSKFDQIYTLYTYSRVFDVSWSNSPNGVWDHSTAIELSNANFQTGYGDSTIYMPRVTQGILRNVWIEHTRNPGDLSDGGWTIER